MVAAEDAMLALSAAPTRRQQRGLAERATSTSRATWLPPSGARPSVITFMPRQTKPKPRIAVPTLLAAPRRAKKLTANPAPTSRSENSWILNARSWTVNVVPMSAPRMTPRDWGNESSPAETNPMSIRVVADEDWIMAVTSAPEPTAARRFRVMLVSRWRRWPPAARCSPSPMSCMQYRRSARPPKSASRVIGPAPSRGEPGPARRAVDTGQVRRLIHREDARGRDAAQRAVPEREAPDRGERQPQPVGKVRADDAAM